MASYPAEIGTGSGPTRANRTVNARTGRRRMWFDPRFGVGIALIAGSVTGVTVLVTAADRTVPVYAAASALAAGDRITDSDLVQLRVRLGSAGSLYLGGNSLPPDGVVVTRAVAAGELVPVSAVSPAAISDTAPLVLATTAELSRGVEPGAAVDVWAAKKLASNSFGPPAVLVEGASVVRVLEPGGLIGGGPRNGVEVLVPKDRIARVLESIANADAISLVPISAPLVR